MARRSDLLAVAFPFALDGCWVRQRNCSLVDQMDRHRIARSYISRERLNSSLPCDGDDRVCDIACS